MPPSTSPPEVLCELPPLILHPFNERTPPATLLENSKASLMLSGLIPTEGVQHDELTRRLLTGRYAEIRMLFFLGRDVCRWITQCLEIAQRNPSMKDEPYTRQSFAGLLAAPPANVAEKLVSWGVVDFPSVFARAVGMNALFAEPPAFEVLSEDFLRHYYRYADLLYRGFMESEAHKLATSKNFHFDLYASGEYSKMLESQWNAG